MVLVQCIQFIAKIHKSLFTKDPQTYGNLIAQRMKLIQGISENSINIYLQQLGAKDSKAPQKFLRVRKITNNNNFVKI